MISDPCRRLGMELTTQNVEKEVLNDKYNSPLPVLEGDGGVGRPSVKPSTQADKD